MKTLRLKRMAKAWLKGDYPLMATNKDDPEFDHAVLMFVKLTRRRQFDVLCDLMSTYRQSAKPLTRKLSPTHDECRHAFIRSVLHEGRE